MSYRESVEGGVAPSELEPPQPRLNIRLVILALVLGLVAGAGGGFAAGRATSTSETSQDTAVLGAQGRVTSDSNPRVPQQDVRLLPTTEALGEHRRLFLRESDGISVRVYEVIPPLPTGAECVDPSTIVIELSNRGAAHVTTAPGGLRSDDVALRWVHSGTFGGPEGDPATWVALRTGPGVERVRAQFPGDRTDEMAPVDGWAVLVHAEAVPGGVIEALNGAGDVVATDDLSRVPRVYIDPPCEPVEQPTTPPPPVPTGPPPVDPAAAEDAIRAAYAHAFTGPVNGETLTAVDDGENLGSTFDTAIANFPEAARTVKPTISEVTFLNDHEAAVRFELNYTGGLEFGPQQGRAVLIDGSWKVARDTYCLALGWAGAICPPRA